MCTMFFHELAAALAGGKIMCEISVERVLNLDVRKTYVSRGDLYRVLDDTEWAM